MFIRAGLLTRPALCCSKSRFFSLQSMGFRSICLLKVWVRNTRSEGRDVARLDHKREREREREREVWGNGENKGMRWIRKR